MIVTCRNILNLPGLEKMKVVAGKGSLDRGITWAHVIEVPDVGDFVKGGELLFITGIAIGNNSEVLLKFIKDIISRNLSGLVINIGPYIKETPKGVIDFANTAGFPIFELPFEVKLIDVTQIICRAIFARNAHKESVNNFMREVIFEDINIDEEMLDRAILYGYKREKKYCSLIVDIDNFSSYIKKKNIDDEEIISNIKNRVQDIVEYVLDENNKKYFYAVQSDAFYFMVCSNVENIDRIAESIRNEISKRMGDITVSIGIGDECSDLKDFKCVILEAIKALKLSKIFGKKNCVIKYKGLGIFRLFFDIETNAEMKKLFDENLLKLKIYDEKNSSVLVKTLIAYLKENRNLGKTAEKLYIHRNTIKYRINRIEEILNCDLKDDETVFNIMLCIKIGVFLRLI
ncbi:PucR family transcriptional regulator [Clostridium ljungdahlii]|uniref:PucR family transcriptional regulator n=1 Tax=Clostridium ljungdahlii TaxID=1538 RepID=UPI003864BCA2